MVISVICLAVKLVLAQANLPLFAGSWVGTLEYRDFSDNSRQKLGTLLRIYPRKGTSDWQFRYVYDDGPHKVVQELEIVSVDRNRHKYKVASEDGKEVTAYGLDDSRLMADGTGVIVLTGPGTENDARVDVRTTVKITSDHLDFLRETRLPGQAFQFRHEYLFTLVSRS